MSGFKNRTAMTVGLLLLCAVPGLARLQTAPSLTTQTPPGPLPIDRPSKAGSPVDDFAGLTYTPDQQSKIVQIHQATKAKMDIVIKDEKLDGDQKNAFLEGLA